MIDLHCHSTYSDGRHSPEELILKAQANGLQCLALTDHDTTSGLDDLHAAGKRLAADITLINGIELSVGWRTHVIHILGLNLKNYQRLDAVINQQNENRIHRAEQISHALGACGVEDAYDKARELAGHERVGRPHFAQVLVNEKKARDFQGAFRQYLGRGRQAYVPTAWMSAEEAVAAIHDAEGLAVIAHPLKYGLTRTKLHELIRLFKDAGGDGIEVVSGEMTPVQIQEIAGLCLRFDLLASSGSDFHGDALSRISLGRQAQLPVNCKPIWHDWTI